MLKGEPLPIRVFYMLISVFMISFPISLIILYKTGNDTVLINNMMICFIIMHIFMISLYYIITLKILIITKKPKVVASLVYSVHLLVFILNQALLLNGLNNISSNKYNIFSISIILNIILYIVFSVYNSQLLARYTIININTKIHSNVFLKYYMLHFIGIISLIRYFEKIELIKTKT